MRVRVPVSSVFQTSSFVSAIMKWPFSEWVHIAKERIAGEPRQEGSWAVALGEGTDPWTSANTALQGHSSGVWSSFWPGALNLRLSLGRGSAGWGSGSQEMQVIFMATVMTLSVKHAT